MAGIPVNRDQVDFKVGQVVIQLRNVLREVETVAAYLARTNDEALRELGYTQDEAYLLRLAFERLELLRQAVYGKAAIPEPVTLMAPADQLTGLE